MDIRKRLIFSVLVTAFFLLLIYIAFVFVTNRKNDYIRHIQKDEIKSSVTSLLQLETRTLANTVSDYSCFDWMTRFIENPDTADAKSNISPVEILNIDFFHVYNLHQQLLYSDYSVSNGSAVSVSPLVMNKLYRIRKCNYFVRNQHGLYQIAGSTVHVSSDVAMKGAPYGYFFGGKCWDTIFLKDLSQLIQGNAGLVFEKSQLPNETSDTVSIPLYSFEKQAIAYLLLYKHSYYMERIRSLNNYFGKFMILATIFIFLIIFFSYNIYIHRPLKKMIETLNTDTPANLISLAMQQDEFGKISRLIMEFFNQRNIIRDKLLELNQAYDEMANLNHELNAQKDALEDTTNNLLKANKEVELHHKEITESIDYAKIIQSAVLEIPETFSVSFPENFILFQPRNIISGDFYWIRLHQNKYYVIGADCTGHSLAGALLSMMGVSLLNNMLNSGFSENAAAILNNMRQSLITALHQKGKFGEAHGGMDMVACIIDLKTNTADYAGAYNPLYIVRQTGLEETKGDPMPVGFHVRNDPFTNHTVPLYDGDMLYIVSDGYSDQFGGQNEKKFNARNFRELLLEIAPQPIDKQKDKLQEVFDTWKGNFEQTDDVMVLGFRYRNELNNSQ